MKRRFILSILLFSMVFIEVGCSKAGYKSNVNNENSDKGSIVKNIVLNEKGMEREIEITEEQSKKLTEEIDKLLKSDTDKPYERKFSSFFKFGKKEILFDSSQLRDRDKNNEELKAIMEADIKEHRNGGVSEEIIEKKFGKEGSKIRTTATVNLNINGKGYSIYNDEKIVDLLVELLK